MHIGKRLLSLQGASQEDTVERGAVKPAAPVISARIPRQEQRVLKAAVQSAVSEADGAVDARAAIAVASIPLDDAPAQSLADGLLDDARH